MSSPPPYQPAENLTNRTFVGLIVAQFLAGFNDQAIHASAMFYAIHTAILSEANAITLMPILFYAPWAIFCTLAGYYADRFSKTMTLRTWKISEIVISLLLLLGFYLGSDAGLPFVGGWLVMSCVFLMGTHAAFFAPAKYGAMPEILQPHVLSRGNGILESTTFLASILGTVGGGLLFAKFSNEPIWIGIILLVISIIGTVASFMIVWLPAASPEKLFPKNLVSPIIDSLKVMFRSRPLALAMLGIAFFIFMVAYMRAAMYMHGETRNPRWDPEKTSLIVATVALGVGLGSPLAGYLSGGKIELGLVPIGCLGMTIALFVAAAAIEHTGILVGALILIGFGSGFYMVPLYTLLQQRAPKKSKGELVATSNFINVTGAIAASILFNVLVQLGRLTSVTPEIKVDDNIAAGKITEIAFVESEHSKIKLVRIDTKDHGNVRFKAKSVKRTDDDELEEKRVVEFDDNLFDVLSGALKPGDEVIVSRYNLRGVRHYLIRRPDQPMRQIYDNEVLPRFLFIGAAFMTLGILFLLYRKLPDFFVRSLFWFQSLGKFRIKAVGMQNLPTEGPVILATNCKDMQSSLQLVSATDRTTKVILVEDPTKLHNGKLLRSLAEHANFILVRPDQDVQTAWQDALTTLQDGHLLAFSLSNDQHKTELASLVEKLHHETNAPIVPVFCGATNDDATPRVSVVFGPMVQSSTSPGEQLEACRSAIVELGESAQSGASYPHH